MSMDILNKPQGWVPNPEGVERILDDPLTAVNRMTQEQRVALDGLRFRGTKRTFLLTDALLKLEPGWKRFAQGIGDCVSWGWEIAGTLVVAVDIVTKSVSIEWPGVMATEPIYGGSRVEAVGKSRGGWSDGSYGAAAAKWASKWGYIARQDYSKFTGINEHNLVRYDAKKAKNWGNFGCGGERDEGKLDAIAKKYPAREVIQVKTFDDAVRMLESGYAIAVCSNVGFDGKRRSDGFKDARGTWYHCMTFYGVKYNDDGEAIAVACMQSWGNSEGEDNAAEFGANPEVAKCSWWVNRSTANRMLSQGDSYAVTGINGFQPRIINWSTGWEVTGQ